MSVRGPHERHDGWYFVVEHRRRRSVVGPFPSQEDADEAVERTLRWTR